jgi:hypothetical protein
MAAGIAPMVDESVTDELVAVEDCDIGFLVNSGLVMLRKEELKFI